MVSVKEPHPAIALDAAVDRMKLAFERLQVAWEAIRARRSANGKMQIDEATMIELDAAEEEWLTARSTASNCG